MRRLALSIILFFAFFNLLQAQSSQSSKWGPNDTIVVQAIVVDGEIYPYSEMPEVTISKLPYQQMVKQMQAYNRLRNAVYVTYPYARQAGLIINDVNVHLLTVSDKGDWKQY